MGPTSRANAFVCALVLAWGCGGMVVVDSTAGGGETTGSGGSRASGASSSGSSASSSGLTCDFACGGPIGLCGCMGPCSDGKTRAIGCGGDTAGGYTCDCVVDNETIGTCDSPGLACNLPGSCCEAIFGG